MLRGCYDDKEVQVMKEAIDGSKSSEPIIPAPILLKKYGTVFDCLDTNKDGVITIDDYIHLAENFIKFGHTSEVTAHQIKSKMLRLWNDLHGEEAKHGPITMKAYTESILKRGRDMILICATYFFSMVFDCMDQTGKGSVELNEFKIFHKSFGIDSAKSKEVFPVVDINHDGQINFMEFLEAGINYFLTNDDTSAYNLLFGPLVDIDYKRDQQKYML